MAHAELPWLRGSIPLGVKQVLQTLRAGGYQAFLVGGCVRDLVRGCHPRDWDVATDARPQRVLELFPGAVATGARFGTVAVPDPPGQVEVTTMRREWDYRDGRRPHRVQFGDRIEDDLSRRDFTVNAMALDPARGRLLDPYGGQEDLRQGWLRAVGNPVQRFQEDGLRLLRALRLANQLRLRVEPATWKALQEKRGRILAVAPERCREELESLLGQEQVLPGLELLQESGLLYLLLPEVYQHPRLKVAEAAAACAALAPSWRLWRWCGLLAGSRDPEKPLVRLRFSRQDRQQVLRFWQCLWDLPRVPEQDRELRHFVIRLGAKNLKPLQTLVAAVPRWQAQLPSVERMLQLAAVPFPRSPQELAVDGLKLQEELDVKPGPGLGRLLQLLWEDCLEVPGRNREEYLLPRARELIRKM